MDLDSNTRIAAPKLQHQDRALYHWSSWFGLVIASHLRLGSSLSSSFGHRIASHLYLARRFWSNNWSLGFSPSSTLPCNLHHLSHHRSTAIYFVFISSFFLNLYLLIQQK
ncbi:hypothetical protein CICLE_v10023427mg [Citrus x clementina]|uniref:Uncharacterized protein n=1 Tax=Citrus clementina TaxID=85681 RepID=V4TYG6_CITCL|nr:hypothetical protein CICLE_v10023427mg [Citrus x clementina]